MRNHAEPRNQRRIRKMRSGFEGWPCQVMGLALLGVGLAMWGCTAGGAHCMTDCKEGAKGYNTYSRWVCVYDEGRSAGNMSVYSTPEPLSSVCALKREGQLKNVDSAFGGQFKTERECFEKFCIPRLIEVCGSDDRCADPGNWFDRPATRKMYGF